MGRIKYFDLTFQRGITVRIGVPEFCFALFIDLLKCLK
jgi:hypothetical protein